MSRRARAEKRKLTPDYKYNSVVVTKFINYLLCDSKKSKSEKIFYQAIDLLDGKVEGKSGYEIFQESVRNVQPRLEVRSRRIGGSNYQIPIEVREDRQLVLSIRWIIQAARSQSGKPMNERLANELLDAFHNRGTAVKKKEDTHRMADANKAFAHYVV